MGRRKPRVEVKRNMYRGSDHFKEPFGFRVRYPDGRTFSYTLHDVGGVLCHNILKRDRARVVRIADRNGVDVERLKRREGVA